MIFSNCVNWILSTDKDSAQRWTLSSTPHNNDSDSAEPVIISKKQQGPNLPHKLISSHYFLPLLPSNTQVSQAQLAAAYYGAVDFLAYLVDFLWCIDTYSPTLPHLQDFFDMYKCVTIQSKSLNGIQYEDNNDVVRASPGGAGNNRTKGIFDTVLVHKDEREGCWGSKVHLLFLFALPY